LVHCRGLKHIFDFECNWHLPKGLPASRLLLACRIARVLDRQRVHVPASEVKGKLALQGSRQLEKQLAIRAPKIEDSPPGLGGSARDLKDFSGYVLGGA
jgi:hypothetical protein